MRTSDHGSVLIATVMVVAAMASAATVAWQASILAAREVHARRTVLCARYAARAALAAWPDLVDPHTLADVPELRIRAWSQPVRNGRCVIVAEAWCAGSHRRISAPPLDPTACLRFQPLPNSIASRGDVHYPGRRRGMR